MEKPHFRTQPFEKYALKIFQAKKPLNVTEVEFQIFRKFPDFPGQLLKKFQDKLEKNVFKI